MGTEIFSWIILILAMCCLALWIWIRHMDTRPHRLPQMVCPHCQTRGTVTVTKTRTKVGISGGKATAAVFTGGASMLATGLSRKRWVNRCRCARCTMVWDINTG